MSEKRKPAKTIVAVFPGKSGRPRRLRIELFEGRLWPKKFPTAVARGCKRYRVRINGRWSNGDHLYTVTEVLRQLRMVLK